MRFLVIGGSGRTGKLVIDETLQQGHTVTALIRNPASLTPKDGLAIVQGTPSNISDIEKAFSATTDTPNAVIVTLASVRASGNPWATSVSPPRMMDNAHANLIEVMRKHNVSKIVTMSAMGTKESFPNLLSLMRWTIRHSNMAMGYEDHDLVDERLKASGLDFVLVRPTRLTEGEKMPVTVFGDDGKGMSGFAGVSRLSVAQFLVEAAVTDKWDRSTPAIAN